MLEGGKVVKRTGASGTLNSIYLRDPDGNLIEYVALQTRHARIKTELQCRISNVTQ